MSDRESVLTAVQNCIADVESSDLAAVFDASFLAQIPPVQLTEIARRMTRELGRCDGHEVLEELSENSVRVRWYFSGGFHADGVLGWNCDAQPKVVFLNFEVPSRNTDSWAAIEEDVSALPGRISLCVRDLVADRIVASVDRERALGVGSVSKLILFGALLETIAAGRLAWDSLLRLGEEHVSAPSGTMHTWPVGAPLTVHTTAVLLLGLSDNTAADLLLDTLGASTVEGLMDRLEIVAGETCRPFLATRAVFQLAASPPQIQQSYLAGDPATRASIAARVSGTRPKLIEQTSEAWPPGLGWYYSVEEICRLLEHLHHLTASDAVGRAVYGMNRGGLASDDWDFVGYKGGSSPGRVSLCVLCDSNAGKRFAICLTHNATPESVSLDTCAMLVKRATDLALDAGAHAT